MIDKVHATLFENDWWLSKKGDPLDPRNPEYSKEPDLADLHDIHPGITAAKRDQDSFGWHDGMPPEDTGEPEDLGWGYNIVDPRDEHESRRGKSQDLAADVMPSDELSRLKSADRKRVAAALSQGAGGIPGSQPRRPKRFIAGQYTRYKK